MSLTRSPTIPYTTADESLHEPTDDELYNESVYFNVYDPDTGIGGTLRVGNRVNLGYAECLFNVPMPDGSILFNYGRSSIDSNDAFRAAGMEVVCEEPFSRLSLTYEGEPVRVEDPALLATDTKHVFEEIQRVDVTLTLTWTCRYDVFIMDRRGDLAQGILPLAGNHYEQFGFFDGVLRVGETRYEIEEAPSFRDHSWGPRDWLSPRYWNQSIAYFEDGTCASISEIGAPTGDVAMGGGVWTGEGYRLMTKTRIESDYAGEPTNDFPYTVRASDEEGYEFVYQATPLNSLPLRHRTEGEEEGEGGVMRISQVVSSYETDGGVAGWGWTDMWRNLPEGEYPSRIEGGGDGS